MSSGSCTIIRGATLPIYIGKTSYFLYMEAKLTTLVNRPDPKSFFGVRVLVWGGSGSLGSINIIIVDIKRFFLII